MCVGRDVVTGRIELACRPELLRLGLQRLLAADGLEVVADRRADLVVLCERDIGDVAAAVKAALDGGGADVVVVLATGDVNEMLDCVAAGATGFVLESDAAADLTAAVRAVLGGDPFVAPSLLGALLAHHRAERSPRREDDRKLLRLLAGGRATSEIAELLGVAPKTVRNRASLLYRELGVRSRGAAIEAAERRGLLD
jgi:DNA-binding NarL/FixJ family response regulator